MIEWGQISKLKKIPGPKFNPQKIELASHKNFQRNNAAGIAGTIIIPQKTYYNQATKNTVAKIFLPKKIAKSKISNPKNPLIIPVT